MNEGGCKLAEFQELPLLDALFHVGAFFETLIASTHSLAQRLIIKSPLGCALKVFCHDAENRALLVEAVEKALEVPIQEGCVHNNDHGFFGIMVILEAEDHQQTLCQIADMIATRIPLGCMGCYLRAFVRKYADPDLLW